MRTLRRYYDEGPLGGRKRQMAVCVLAGIGFYSVIAWLIEIL